MIAQVTATSLISENKVLAHPASIDSIPTSANQEDHVSMGTIAAVKARNIIENTAYVLGIEMMIAAQALDTRKFKSSKVIEEIKKEIRKKVDFLDRDRILSNDIREMKTLVDSEIFPKLTQRHIDFS